MKSIILLISTCLFSSLSFSQQKASDTTAVTITKTYHLIDTNWVLTDSAVTYTVTKPVRKSLKDTRYYKLMKVLDESTGGELFRQLTTPHVIVPTKLYNTETKSWQ